MRNTTNKLDILSQNKEINQLDNTEDLFHNNEYFTSYAGETKHNPPLIKEWSNGVYSFNKNNDKILPIADTIVDRLIKSYFSMIPLHKGKKTKRTQRRTRRLSLDRILVSKPEIKHTNSKVIITVYLYNKNKKIIINKLKKLYKNFTLKLYKPLVTAAKGQVTARGGVTNKTSSLSSKNRNNLKNTNFKFKARLPRLGQGFSLARVAHLGELGSEAVNKMHKANIANTNNLNNINAQYNELDNSGINKKFKLTNNVTERSKHLNNEVNKPSLNINKDFSSRRLDLVNKNETYNKENLSNLNTKRIIILRKKRIFPIKVKGKLVLAVTNKVSKTYTKKMSKTQSRNSNMLNTSYSVKFANRLKTRLSRFILKNVDKSNKNNNLSLKNKYAFLANRYYSLTNKYRLYSEKNLLSYNNSYYVYYHNILNNNSNTTNKKSIFMPSRVKSLKNVKHIKNIMQKLRGYYKLFYINNTYNNSDIFFNKGWVETAKQKYLYKLLKNPLTVSNYINKNSVSSSLKQKSSALRYNKRENLLLARNKIKTITQKGIEIVKRVRRHKNFLFRILKWNDNNFINYENKFYNKYIKKVYSKELLYLYYIKMLSLNTVKFKNWFLIGLKKVISKLYNKKVEFNFVNLKTIYLNSDIFSNAIAIKLKNRKNSLLPVLKKALTLVNIPSINNVLSYDNNYVNNNDEQNKLGTIKNILNTVKYKSVFGVRFEVAGRLSRRLTASRSVFKLRYKGSLKNIDSVYKNKPIAILRGNLKSNIQYTNVNTKTRNGAFGLKGWVSSH